MTHNGILRLLTLAGCMALAACGQKHSAQEFVRANLIDPESARFGDFYYNSKFKKACLTVNAKNTMGGYTGNKEVHLRKADDGWEEVGVEEETHPDCTQSFADQEIG